MDNFTTDDDALLEALGVDVAPKQQRPHTAREERIIAGFEDIQRFVAVHARAPEHGEERDFFERLYAVRLDQLRKQPECLALLAGRDSHGLLTSLSADGQPAADVSDEQLLAELGVEAGPGDITELRHVRSAADKRAADEIATRQPCRDFDRFAKLFADIRRALDSGVRVARPFGAAASIQAGEFFIVGGQIAYVAELGEEFITEYDRRDRRLRVIYDNGTESNVLLRSLERALHRDPSGRQIASRSAGPLFSDEVDADDSASGTIYVLRSKSDHPTVTEHRKVLHKIGVTGGDLERRLSNAKTDPTFLMADVEIVCTYKLANLNRSKLENLIHRVFDAARLNIEIMDRFGVPFVPREWFLVPLFVIDEAVEKIRNGTIVDYSYVPAAGALVQTRAQ